MNDHQDSDDDDGDDDDDGGCGDDDDKDGRDFIGMARSMSNKCFSMHDVIL